MFFTVRHLSPVLTEIIPKAAFPLVIFYGKNASDIDTWQSLWYLPWPPWAWRYRKDHFYFMSYCPWWPRQVQCWMSRVAVTVSFSNNICPCKWSIIGCQKFLNPTPTPTPKTLAVKAGQWIWTRLNNRPKNIE